MSDNGIDITRYAWVKRCKGEYVLYAVGGPLIGSVDYCEGAWFAYPKDGALSYDEPFKTRAAAGRWLVEQWEGGAK